MSSSGPKSPSSVTSELVDTETVSWDNPGGAATSDNQYASVALATGDLSYALRCTGFGFTNSDIPPGATIDGILVEIEASQDGDADCIAARLVYNGSELGTISLGFFSNVPFTPDGTDTYWPAGGATDTASETVTQAMVVDADFGTDIYFSVDFFGLGSTVSVDHVRMTVYYTENAGAQDLTPSLVTNSQTFYSPTVGRGAVTLSSSLFTNTQTFYAPTITTGAVTLSPSLVSNTQTFYGPTVAPGSVDLAPSLLSNSNSFHAPTVSSLNTLAPSLVTNANSFFAATITTGPVDLAPSLVTNSQTFHAPTVTATYALSPSLVTNSNSFFAPTVSPGAVTLSPSLVTNAQTFHAATVELGPANLSPPLLTNTNQFFAPTVTPEAVTLTPPLLTNSQTFYAPAVAAIYDLFPPLLASGTTFYAPTVTVGPVTLSPTLFTNAAVFFTATVEGQGLTIAFGPKGGSRGAGHAGRDYRTRGSRSMRSGSSRAMR